MHEDKITALILTSKVPKQRTIPVRVDKDEVLPQALMTGYSWAHVTPFLFGPCADFYMKEPIHEDTGSVLGEALSLLADTCVPSGDQNQVAKAYFPSTLPPLEKQGLG